MENMKKQKGKIIMGIDEAERLVNLVETLWDYGKEGICCGRMNTFHKFKRLVKK